MPERTIARARSTEIPPASSLTVWQPVSLTRRWAFWIGQLVARLVAAHRHVADHQRRLQAAPHGLAEHDHLLHRDRLGAGVAEHDHRRRVADEDDVDAGLLGDLGRGVVVGGDHRDRFAGRLHLGQARQGDRRRPSGGGAVCERAPELIESSTSGWLSTATIALLVVDVDDDRRVGLEVALVVGAEGGDDDLVAGPGQVGGGAVDLHRAGAGLAVDHVGDEAGAVVDVPDVDLLVGDQVGAGHQLGVDRDAADVVDVAVGHRRPVDLGLEHLPLHQIVASVSALSG